MILALTPKQFKQLTKVLEAAQRAMTSAEEGEVTLSQNAEIDSIEWCANEVRITLQD